MDTVYYNLQAKRVKVSGGADLVTFLPASAPAPGQGAGEVLDFARCRQKLETKAAWKELRQAAYAPEEDFPTGEASPEAPVSPARSSHREQAAGWLELAASAAVIAMSIAAVLAFLRLV